MRTFVLQALRGMLTIKKNAKWISHPLKFSCNKPSPGGREEDFA